MSIFRSISASVISCFKRVERGADWLTGAAGPVFVALCWALIVAGGLAFFDVLIYNNLTLPRLLLTPIYILIAINLYGHYYLVLHIDPGHPSLSIPSHSHSSLRGNHEFSSGSSGVRIIDGRGRWVVSSSGNLMRFWPAGVRRGDGPWRWKGGGEDGRRARREAAAGVEPLQEGSGRQERSEAFEGAYAYAGNGNASFDESSIEQARTPEHKGSQNHDNGIEQRGPSNEHFGKSSIVDGHGGHSRKRIRRCRRCQGPKPDRTHHCSVCKRCVLLMDHHCPWINQCVGLHNQRHFLLFMASLTLACWILVLLGWDELWTSLGPGDQWAARTPAMVFTLEYILSVAIGVAVPVLLSWHLYLISQGETSIESHDNAYFGRKAKAQGKVYVNPWDVGARRNLELAFNVGSGGYPYRTLFLPLRITPYTSGWHYPQHPMAEAVAEGAPLPDNTIVGDDEGLTDDEEGGGAGFWDGNGV